MKQKKISILIINGHLKIGGIERSLVDVLNHIDYNKYDVDLLLLEGTGEYINEVPDTVNIINYDIRPAYGSITSILQHNLQKGNWFAIKYRIALILIQLFGNNNFRLMPNLFKIKRNYDIAIAYRIGLYADIIAYGIIAKQKLCWWHHGAIPEDINLKTLEQTWIRYNRIIAVSNGVYNILSNHFNDFVPKLLVVPNMVDIKRIRSKSLLNENPYNNYIGLKFVSIGRFSPEKHFENIIKAATQLKMDKRLVFKWYIIGDGELYGCIKELIQNANLEDNVILCGSMSNPYPYIKHADIMIHTSHIESQGLVIQEAMALETPCIVTRSLGPSEYLVDGENSIIVEQSINSLINGIYRLINNKKLQLKITHNGLNTIKEYYSPRAVISRLKTII